jgi:hypothetical protein
MLARQQSRLALHASWHDKVPSVKDKNAAIHTVSSIFFWVMMQKAALMAINK